MQGELRWAQLLDRVPKIADQHLYNNIIPTAPLVTGNMILLCAEGSPTLVCLDRMTGSLLWQHQQPGLQKMVGIYDDQIILVCQSGIQSLQLEDGATRWFYPVAVNPQSVLIHNDHVLALTLDKPLATTQLSLDPERGILWIHPQTGNVEHHFSLQEENKVFFDAEQIFTFADQVVVVSNVDINARTFKLLGLPVK
ncbi:MAG: PQQ-binding-like beta-propeller repeat protein [Pirellulaceae bacterium]